MYNSEAMEKLLKKILIFPTVVFVCCVIVTVILVWELTMDPMVRLLRDLGEFLESDAGIRYLWWFFIWR